MKKRTNKRPPRVSQKTKSLSISGGLPFHAGVVIRAIDEALKTETDKIACWHLTHSRQYMCEFEERHPAGVIPRQMDKEEFLFTRWVLETLTQIGVSPTLADRTTMQN